MTILLLKRLESLSRGISIRLPGEVAEGGTFSEAYLASTSKRNIIGQREIKKNKEIGMQGSKLYVGNLSYSVTSEELEELFSGHGKVKQVNIIQGRGFGFVEMSSPSEAEKAKEALNGSDFKGRSLKVDEARPPRSREKSDYQRY